jgi:uncharacterized protein (DUF2141 family)
LLPAHYQFAIKKDNVDVIVEITNISNDKGQVIVKLYNSEKTFRKTVYKREVAKINAGKAKLVFTDIPNGFYSFSVVHDKNNNGKIDFNILGVPSEAVAASNNAKGFMGPPSYDDAKFEVNGKSVIQKIKM